MIPFNMPRILLFCLVLAGCTTMVEPVGPVPLTPGEVQANAVASINACAGSSVRVSDIDWYRVDAIAGHEDAAGAWNPPNVIYLLDGWTDNRMVTAHEVLHHVLRGDSGHLSALWTVCGVMP